VTYSEKKAIFRTSLEQIFQRMATDLKKIADNDAAETDVCAQKLQVSS